MIQNTDPLTPRQLAQLSAYIGKWIDIGLRSGPADRQAFEAAARRCYEYAQIPWHGNVIWVSSPLVLGAAASIAEVAGCEQGCVLSVIDEAVVGKVERECRAGYRFELGDAGSAVRVALLGVGAVEEDEGTSMPEIAVYQDLPELEKNGFLPAVEDAVRRAVLDSHVSSVGDDELPSLIRQALQGELHASGILYGTPGQFMAGVYKWGGLGTSFLRDVWGLELSGDLWDRARAYEETLCHCCYWYPHRRFLIVCEHPREIHRERRDRDAPAWWYGSPLASRDYPASLLHRGDGPAVSWPDGWGIYAIHGVHVPGWIIDHPEAITVKSIEDERNAEVRRIMLDRYGWARYMADSGAEVVDQIPDDHPIEGLRGARLLSKVLPDEPEPIVYLEMVNSTPGADGARSRYLERIDPKAYDGDAARLCHAAMASRWRHRDERGELRLTFTRWQDYVPSHES